MTAQYSDTAQTYWQKNKHEYVKGETSLCVKCGIYGETNAIHFERHDFIPSSKSLHPLETCNVCGTDPRNALHTGVKHGLNRSTQVTWCGVRCLRDSGVELVGSPHTVPPIDLGADPVDRAKQLGITCELCLDVASTVPRVGRTTHRHSFVPASFVAVDGVTGRCDVCTHPKEHENHRDDLGRIHQGGPLVREKVEHPSHYGGADNPYETIKVLEAWLTPEELRGFLKGNAIKYLSRAGKKQGESALDDFKKAEWYSKRATALEEGKK